MNQEPTFAFPKGCPPHVVDRLMAIAKDVATVFGQDATRDGVLITDEMIPYMVSAIAVGLMVATHDALHRSEALLSDEKVKRWLAENPPTPMP